ncbi:MAG TPA: hypothetical protein VH092_12860 [Urbifossiella sp.]|jgi:hypothetical protein|nr:hypothetical protein [Urbifossiella sp.]
MTRFSRVALVAVFGGVLGTPGVAPAQFAGGYFGGYSPLQLRPLGVPTPVPLNFNYTQQYSFRLNTAFGSYNVGRTIGGPAGYYWLASQNNYRNYSYLYPQAGSGYMAGGVGGNQALAAAQADFARAQRAAAAVVPAKAAVHDQWAYEKFGAPGAAAVKAGPDAPEAVARALAATDEREIATGEPLNHLLVAAVAAEKKAGKVDSAFLPPNLLADLKFAGPQADAANLLRRAGRLDYPAGFDLPALADVRAALDREFAAAASPVLIGKAADPARAAKLEAAVVEARKALAPQIREMSFEDAAAARRFLNQMDATARALRGPGTAGLIDPAWQVEGTNVAGLVRYMSRNNLLFAPADRGTEDRYAAAHRGLGTYLYALTEAQKKK